MPSFYNFDFDLKIKSSNFPAQHISFSILKSIEVEKSTVISATLLCYQQAYAQLLLAQMLCCPTLPVHSNRSYNQQPTFTLFTLCSAPVKSVQIY
jgi:hypothetical protein